MEEALEETNTMCLLLLNTGMEQMQGVTIVEFIILKRDVPHWQSNRITCP